MAELIGLTGKSGSGKTKSIQAIIKAAQNAGISLFGFYCPAIFQENEKIGMQVCLLPDGEPQILGLLEKRKNWFPIGQWWMDPDVFELVNDHIKRSVKSDLLIIDEIGPAEIEVNTGWPAAMELLKEDRFKLGIVSFRPAFISFFKEKYPGIKVIDLDEGGQREIDHLIERFCKADLPG
ncbi:MAG TPA: nucleoside-triphosphatase [Anaerolineaceae bacterium]|nr:nucleoside-triphosphatase [Anaerolineaceae bacterium]